MKKTLIKHGDIVYGMHQNMILELKVIDVLQYPTSITIRCVPVGKEVKSTMTEKTPHGYIVIPVINYMNFDSDALHLSIDALLTSLVHEFDERKKYTSNLQ